MSLRPAEDRDLPAIAALHKAQFSTYFLGQYPLRTLVEYYRSFLKQSVLLVHETTTGLDGFLLGGKPQDLSQGAMTFLRRNWLHCLGDTLLCPRLWLEAPRRALIYIIAARRNLNCRDQLSKESIPSILSLAVAEEAKGTGVAAALIGAFEQEIKDYADAYGFSVLKSNSRAIRFYHKMGLEVQQDKGVYYLLRKKLR